MLYWDQIAPNNGAATAESAEWQEEAKRPCPRCGDNPLHPVKAFNALSRVDNKTMVCSPCGMAEAIIDYLAPGALAASGKSRWARKA